MTRKFITLILFALLASATTMQAQEQTLAEGWKPTGVWPFVHRLFQKATVYTGLFNITKTEVRCNVHVGKQNLWFFQRDTLMEAVPGKIMRVEFKNGDVYVPFSAECIGQIVREDTIDGKISRVICSHTVNKAELDKRDIEIHNNTAVFQSAEGFLSGLVTQMTDANIASDVTKLPLPMIDEFYFLFRGEIFPFTQKNLLKRVKPERKNELRNFFRQAEILSHNEASVLKVWKEFFLNWEGKPTKKK